MTTTALALVLSAAVMHAAWNYMAKRAGGGLPFVWIVAAMSTLLWLPIGLVAWVLTGYELTWETLGFVIGGGVLHIGYSLLLQRGYRTGQLSVVYPLARGTGPLVTVIGAALILGERPSALALAGGLLIIGAIFWIASEGRGLKVAASARGAAYGIACGLFIAGYTLWDKQAVAAALIPPLVYDSGANAARTIMLAPFAWRRRSEVVREWRVNLRLVIGVSVLSPLAYFLILTAMTFTPVSYVAPAREVSIVIGSFLGARMLKEGDWRRRIFAAVLIAIGIAALALG